MKKTLAMAISAMLCLTAATPTIASAAIWLADPQNAIYYEKNEAFSEYSSYCDFYMPVGSTEFRPPYIVHEGDDLSGDLIILSHWGVDWTLYTVTDEEYAALEAFLAAEHPTVTLTEIEERHSTCHLVYSEPLTYEEEFALAQDIKAATGLEVGFISPNSWGIIVNRVDEDILYYEPLSDTYYAKHEALSEYTSYHDFYIPVGSTEIRQALIVDEDEGMLDDGSLSATGQWGANWTWYTVTEEEYAVLEAFLAEEHPTVTLTEYDETRHACYLVYSETLTNEEEFALAQEIKAGTGLTVGFITTAGTGVRLIKVDAAAAETTTTTVAETTTTTTTTTAGAVQAGEKGAAGMALAAMGAATVAFVMKKKKFG